MLKASPTIQATQSLAKDIDIYRHQKQEALTGLLHHQGTVMLSEIILGNLRRTWMPPTHLNNQALPRPWSELNKSKLPMA